MKFLLDANIPSSVLEVFKSRNQEAIHVANIGLVHATDEEIINYAKRTHCIIVTRDLDFGTLAVYHRTSMIGAIILRLPLTATRSKNKGNPQSIS
jgi:predicted nuclease of predicted toxin-antitoxin system